MDAEDIRLIRKTMGLTQSEFAEVIGKSLRTAQMYERGESTPSSNALIKLIELKAKYLSESKLTDIENTYLDQIDDKYKSIDPQEIVLYLTKNHEELLNDPVYKAFVKNAAYELALDIISAKLVGNQGKKV